MHSRLVAASILVLALVAVSAVPAHAVLITVEPDDFAAGTDISAAVAGVTLSAFSEAPIIIAPVPTPAVLSSDNTIGSWAPTGTRVFGNTASTGWGSTWYTGDNLFRADFTTPTSFVSIRTGPDALDDPGDPARFEIYDSSNVLLGSIEVGNIGTGLALTSTTLVSFTRPAADIAYLVARNPIGVSGESFILDELVFDAEPIPEPGTLLLLGSGLTGLALRRRRRG